MKFKRFIFCSAPALFFLILGVVLLGPADLLRLRVWNLLSRDVIILSGENPVKGWILSRDKDMIVMRSKDDKVFAIESTRVISLETKKLYSRLFELIINQAQKFTFKSEGGLSSTEKINKTPAGRVYVRAAVNISGKVFGGSRKPEPVRISNLSTTGIRFFTLDKNVSLPARMFVRFRLGIFSRAVTADIEVKNSSQDMGIGAAFVSLSGKDSRHIENFICSRHEQARPMRLLNNMALFCWIDCLVRAIFLVLLFVFSLLHLNKSLGFFLDFYSAAVQTFIYGLFSSFVFLLSDESVNRQKPVFTKLAFAFFLPVLALVSYLAAGYLSGLLFFNRRQMAYPALYYGVFLFFTAFFYFQALIHFVRRRVLEKSEAAHLNYARQSGRQ